MDKSYCSHTFSTITITKIITATTIRKITTTSIRVFMVVSAITFTHGVKDDHTCTLPHKLVCSLDHRLENRFCSSPSEKQFARLDFDLCALYIFDLLTILFFSSINDQYNNNHIIILGNIAFFNK